MPSGTLNNYGVLATHKAYLRQLHGLVSINADGMGYQPDEENNIWVEPDPNKECDINIVSGKSTEDKVIKFVTGSNGNSHQEISFTTNCIDIDNSLEVNSYVIITNSLIQDGETSSVTFSSIDFNGDGLGHSSLKFGTNGSNSVTIDGKFSNSGKLDLKNKFITNCALDNQGKTYVNCDWNMQDVTLAEMFVNNDGIFNSGLVVNSETTTTFMYSTLTTNSNSPMSANKFSKRLSVHKSIMCGAAAGVVQVLGSGGVNVIYEPNFPNSISFVHTDLVNVAGAMQVDDINSQATMKNSVTNSFALLQNSAGTTKLNADTNKAVVINNFSHVNNDNVEINEQVNMENSLTVIGITTMDNNTTNNYLATFAKTVKVKGGVLSVGSEAQFNNNVTMAPTCTLDVQGTQGVNKLSVNGGSIVGLNNAVTGDSNNTNTETITNFDMGGTTNSWTFKARHTFTVTSDLHCYTTNDSTHFTDTDTNNQNVNTFLNIELNSSASSFIVDSANATNSDAVHFYSSVTFDSSNGINLNSNVYLGNDTGVTLTGTGNQLFKMEHNCHDDEHNSHSLHNRFVISGNSTNVVFNSNDLVMVTDKSSIILATSNTNNPVKFTSTLSVKKNLIINGDLEFNGAESRLGVLDFNDLPINQDSVGKTTINAGNFATFKLNVGDGNLVTADANCIVFHSPVYIENSLSVLGKVDVNNSIELATHLSVANCIRFNNSLAMNSNNSFMEDAHFVNAGTYNCNVTITNSLNITKIGDALDVNSHTQYDGTAAFEVKSNVKCSGAVSTLYVYTDAIVYDGSLSVSSGANKIRIGGNNNTGNGYFRNNNGETTISSDDIDNNTLVCKSNNDTIVNATNSVIINTSRDVLIVRGDQVIIDNSINANEAMYCDRTLSVSNSIVVGATDNSANANITSNKYGHVDAANHGFRQDSSGNTTMHGNVKVQMKLGSNSEITVKNNEVSIATGATQLLGLFTSGNLSIAKGLTLNDGGSIGVSSNGTSGDSVFTGKLIVGNSNSEKVVYCEYLNQQSPDKAVYFESDVKINSDLWIGYTDSSTNHAGNSVVFTITNSGGNIFNIGDGVNNAIDKLNIQTVNVEFQSNTFTLNCPDSWSSSMGIYINSEDDTTCPNFLYRKYDVNTSDATSSGFWMAGGDGADVYVNSGSRLNFYDNTITGRNSTWNLQFHGDEGSQLKFCYGGDLKMKILPTTIAMGTGASIYTSGNFYPTPPTN